MTLVDAVLLLPRNAVLLFLWVYRRLISPLYGDVCRYYPSCSAYGVTAVQQHGALRGAVRTLVRIVRCNPWASGGIDDVPPKNNFRYTVTARGFVATSRHRKG